MRGVALAVLVVLAGCAAPAPNPTVAPAGATLPELEAHYTYTNRANDEVEWRGSLDVRSKPARILMDRDEELRAAWIVEADFQFTIPQDILGSLATQDYTYHTVTQLGLDASFHLVRADTVDLSTYAGPNVRVDWGVQGALPPHGIAWPALARDGRITYQVDGANTTATVVDDEGWMRLAEGSAQPFGAADPDARYRFDNPWLPERIYVRKELPGMSLQEQWFNRTNLRIGTEQEPVPDWPKRPYADARAGPDLYLPGEVEEAFGMGVTYRDLIEELRRREPEADADLDGGCVGFAFVMLGGSLNPQPDQFDPYRPMMEELGLIHDGLSVFVRVVNSGRVIDYQITYSPGSPVEAAQQPLGLYDPYSTSREIALSPIGYEHVCKALPFPLAAPTGGGRTAWRTPTLDTGVPCGLVASSRTNQRAGMTNTNGGPLLDFLLMKGPEESNRGRDQDFTGWGSASFDVTSGLWNGFSILPPDLERMDKGEFKTAPRDLPKESPPQLGEPKVYRCVEPDLVESILPETASAAATATSHHPNAGFPMTRVGSPVTLSE